MASADPADDRAIHNLVVTAGRFVRIVHLVLVIVGIFMIDSRFSSTGRRIAAVVGRLATSDHVTGRVTRRAARPASWSRPVSTCAANTPTC